MLRLSMTPLTPDASTYHERSPAPPPMLCGTRGCTKQEHHMGGCDVAAHRKPSLAAAESCESQRLQQELGGDFLLGDVSFEDEEDSFVEATWQPEHSKDSEQSEEDEDSEQSEEDEEDKAAAAMPKPKRKPKRKPKCKPSGGGPPPKRKRKRGVVKGGEVRLKGDSILPVPGFRCLALAASLPVENECLEARFATFDEAQSHSRETHGQIKSAKTCPGIGCGKAFSSVSAMGRHARLQ